MNNKEWEKALAEKLNEVFGKNTFTEEELTKEFYVELRIRCAVFFQTEDDAFDQELFWSDGLRDWLMQDKP